MPQSILVFCNEKFEPSAFVATVREMQPVSRVTGLSLQQCQDMLAVLARRNAIPKGTEVMTVFLQVDGVPVLEQRWEVEEQPFTAPTLTEDYCRSLEEKPVI